MLALLAPLRRVRTRSLSGDGVGVAIADGGGAARAHLDNVEILGGGGKESAKRDGFRSLWRKMKPEGAPNDVRGISVLLLLLLLQRYEKALC